VLQVVEDGECFPPGYAGGFMVAVGPVAVAEVVERRLAGIPPEGGSDFSLFDEINGDCLGIQGSSTASGAYANVGDSCTGTQTQTWFVLGTTTVGGNFGFQFANGNGLCLGVSGDGLSSGALVQQETCFDVSDHAQIWRPAEMNAAGKITYYTSAPGTWEGSPGWVGWLVNGHSGLCLAVKGSSGASGALVVQSTCTFATGDEWAQGSVPKGAGGQHQRPVSARLAERVLTRQRRAKNRVASRQMCRARRQCGTTGLACAARRRSPAEASDAAAVVVGRRGGKIPSGLW
jgi:hypothetical protein